jgi:uncharacterized protein (DUF983 family)
MKQPPTSIKTSLARALRGYCPACGEGRVVRGFTNLRRDCPECGWILEREPGAITGAMTIASILSQFAAVGVMLLCWWLTDWSTPRILLTGLPILAVISYVALAISKRVWIAVEYATDMRTDEAGEDYKRRAYRKEP